MYGSDDFNTYILNKSYFPLVMICSSNVVCGFIDTWILNRIIPFREIQNTNNISKIQNPGYMKENFFIIIESLHLPDKGDQQNVHELPPDKLKQREIIMVDIANDPVNSSDYKPTEDPQKFNSSKTGRGPLNGKWPAMVSQVLYLSYLLKNYSQVSTN